MPGVTPGEAVVASSRSLLDGLVAAATASGRVFLARVVFTPIYEAQRLAGLDVALLDRGSATIDVGRDALRQVAYREDDSERYVAALVGEREVAFWRAGEGTADAVRDRVTLEPGVRLTHVRIGRHGAVVAGSDTGRLYHWMFDRESARLTDVVEAAAGDAITALEFLVGGNSIVAGTAAGSVTSWFRAAMPDGSESFVRGHTYEPQGSAVVALAASPRDRTFAVAGADGSMSLRHQTSERTLASVPPGGPSPGRLLIAPKADGLFADAAGAVRAFDIDNPHPEISWRALFGKVWYEGYSEPEYVWQSTGGTDAFEPKLSLIPLIFGTVKGTLYAMLFAVPLAILAALYTSQFMDARYRARIKPTVEIMAALPSVVIGFLAGLYLAGVVERHLVGVWLMVVLLPAFGAAGVLIWRLLPRGVRQRALAGAELLVILPLLLLAGWLAMAIGPTVEGWWFGGDARLWLQDVWGLTYDQRNCLVVGIAMGFAVIPIIFTISEDAFSTVPSSLRAASLALGATRWQTAIRVIVPTASPGVFSAVMIGFGRAVGETMIVLMATGNTPVMEWSIFNGIRTLSANIAVEIPEAPHGGTLYRTLFLAALLLFAMTFVINTIAEVIRQRLRERYRAV
jgi:phosphate transport system permease protein